jgi:hypothetical protein
MAGLTICTPCTDTLGKRYDAAFCKTVLRPFGSDKMIGFHCSVNFIDILDVSQGGEWETYLTDGKILLSPFNGNFSIGDSNTTTLEDGCGNKIPDITETPWTFTTPATAEDYSDEDWWHAFHQDFKYWNWGWLTCSGRLALNDMTVTEIKEQLLEETPGAVATPTPGFPFSLDIIPRFEGINGPGKAGQWRAQGSFRHSHVIRTVEIPGLSTLLAELG